VSELLLLSNSRAPGLEFLEHATDAIRTVLGDRASVLFVPFAGSDPDTYTKVVRQALARIDVQVTSMHEVSDATGALRDAEAIFVGGGNSFRLVRTLNRLGILDALRRAVVHEGVPTSAPAPDRISPVPPSAPPTTCRSSRCLRCPPWG